MMHSSRAVRLSQRYGFTLVELSIVLVILGLLIGGVLTGQSLIRAAELRSVTTQEARYVTAVQTFRDKYFALPGDMTNASSYWGLQAVSSCAGATSTDSKTCNGDGNGQIDVSANANEYFRFWQHLANAGLIEGTYPGVSGGTVYVTPATGYVPAGRISSSLWFSAYVPVQSGGASQLFDGVYDNTLQFGGFSSGADPKTPILKPEEAYNIDAKTDDGKPATGRVVIRAFTSGFAGCTDTSSSATLTANYLLSSTALACALDFRQAF